MARAQLDSSPIPVQTLPEAVLIVLRATAQPCTTGWAGCTVSPDQPQGLSQEYKHRGTGELPDTISVRKLACISIFMSKTSFFKYIRKTSLQIGKHSILKNTFGFLVSQLFSECTTGVEHIHRNNLLQSISSQSAPNLSCITSCSMDN